MHLIPRSFDTKVGRSLARRDFPAPAASDLSFASHSLGLTDAELHFFAANGYLVRRSVIPPELLEFARRYAWSLCPRHFHPNDPSSWRGRVRDSSGKRSIKRRRGRLKFFGGVRQQDWLYELIANNEIIYETAEAMIGGRLEKPGHVRGIESVFPSRVCCKSRPHPNTDRLPFMIGTTTYLTDVVPEGGGFMAWPGSHFPMRLGYRRAAGDGRTTDYHRRLYQMARAQAAVEITGAAGTVIFWHHRLAHGSAINRMDQPRHSVCADFSPSHIDQLIAQPTPIDPWKDWAIDGGLRVG